MKHWKLSLLAKYAFVIFDTDSDVIIICNVIIMVLTRAGLGRMACTYPGPQPNQTSLKCLAYI